MAGKDQNSYGSQGQTNYAPDRQTQYQKNPPPTPEEAYQAKHDNRFTKQLSTVAAQEAYNNKTNILDFRIGHKPGDADKVADVLADYVDGFNKTTYGSDSDRREAASAVADTTFRPLYQQVEQLEAKDELALDPNIADVLKKEGVKYTVVQNDDGSTELKILLRNRKQAEKIEKLTGLEINVLDNNKRNRDEFREIRDLIRHDHRQRRREERQEQTGWNAVGTVNLSEPDDRAWGPAETLKMHAWRRRRPRQRRQPPAPPSRRHRRTRSKHGTLPSSTHHTCTIRSTPNDRATRKTSSRCHPSVTTNTRSPGHAGPGPTEYSRRSSTRSASTPRNRASTWRIPLQKKAAHPRSYRTAASQDTPVNHWNDCKAPIDVIEPAT